jgi:hypothetical protein
MPEKRTSPQSTECLQKQVRPNSLTFLRGFARPSTGDPNRPFGEVDKVGPPC